MRRIGELLFVGLLAAMPEPSSATQPIIDGPTILQQSPVAIQASLGRPIRTKVVPPGDFQLPEGGTLRVYTGRGARIDVDFENERSTTVVIAFADPAVAPRSYEEALEAVNLRSGSRPDLIGRDRRAWRTLDGYFVQVIAAYPALDRIDTIVLSVHPLP